MVRQIQLEEYVSVWYAVEFNANQLSRKSYNMKLLKFCIEMDSFSVQHDQIEHALVHPKRAVLSCY